MRPPSRLSFVSTFIAFSSLLACVSAEPNAHLLPRNHGIVGRRRHPVNVLEHRDDHLSKRYDNTKFTYYSTGQNACGSVDQDSDFIVALNSAQWNGGSMCYQEITITYNGRTAQAKITDECPGCPPQGLDLSPGLFQFFASESAGVIYGSWTLGGAASPSPSPTPSYTPISIYTPPSSTYTPPPPTTSSYTPPSSTWTPPSSSYTPSSSSVSSSSSVWTSSSVPPSSSSAAPSSTTPLASVSAAVPSATITYDQGTLNQFNLALVGLAGLMGAAAQK